MELTYVYFGNFLTIFSEVQGLDSNLAFQNSRYEVYFLFMEILFKSPQSGVILCFLFISAASAASATSTAATTFAPHIRTV